MIKRFSGGRLALGLILFACGTSSALAECVGMENCTLVWADEFDGNAVNLQRWTFQLGDGTEVGLPSGWGNSELQWYTDQNATVADGMLTIEAREESVEPGFQYTSSRLRTRNKGDWTYGRFEMRAKMPIGKGLWPAFWMLPTDTQYGGWAASGEIDIMEYLGDKPEEVLGTIHYGGEWPNNTFTGNAYVLPEGSFHDDFHVFAIEWEEGEIRWYVDDVLYATQTQWNSTAGDFPAPFNVDFHLLLNMAVGGNLPGLPDENTQFPQQLVVDYVRVYQQTDPDAFTINPGLNDAWFNLATAGQGFLLTVLPDIGQMFLAWFTYDKERPPEDVQAIIGEPGHRWLTAQGTYIGDTANLTVYLTQGGIFDSAEPAPSTDPAGDGSITLEFASCSEALLTYFIQSSGSAGVIPLQRIAPDNVALCEQLNSVPAPQQ